MKKVENAIILAAGEGKRMYPFTEFQPKCFAEVMGVRILENALQALAESGCKTVRIVTGHCAEKIQAVITDAYQNMTIQYIYNPEYKTTNSMYSLYLGLAEASVATWVLEGDVFFEGSILEFPVREQIAWFVDSSTRGVDGAYIEKSSSGLASSLRIIRDLALLKSNDCKSVGVLKLSIQGVQKVCEWLSEGIAQGHQNLYYDLILAEHLNDMPVEAIDVSGRKWFEIDTPHDLECARRLFA